MFSEYSYESILSDMKSLITRVSTIEGTFVSDMLSPLCIELEKAYGQFEKILGLAFLDDLTGEYLDKKCLEYGIYRKTGLYAAGSVIFVGEIDTVIPQNTIVSTKSGLVFGTNGEVTIGDDGTATVGVTAEDTGAIYNQATISNILVGINGVYSVENASEITGGASDEDCDELRQRLITKIQTPATSGNCYDYMNWATTITGIENSKVYPLHHGNGTVMVMPVTSDGRAPTDEQITQVKEYIEEMRPVGADVYIEKPTEQFINITASITHTGVLTTIIQEYTELLNAYIQQSVFSNYTIDFNRCLSLFYTISNVGGLTSFQINGVEENIEINEMGIPVIGEIEITEG